MLAETTCYFKESYHQFNYIVKLPQEIAPAINFVISQDLLNCCNIIGAYHFIVNIILAL